MHTFSWTQPSLFNAAGARKYLNESERLSFFKAAGWADPETRLFCLVLGHSGGRISEILHLGPSAIDIDACTATILTLKRRKSGIARQVPLPAELIGELDSHFLLRHRQADRAAATAPLWNWSRTTAWRRVKMVMSWIAVGRACAMPKGLRHAFGVKAFQANVPPHLVQRWLGHASLRTTGIYCDVIGPEEREFAVRMWNSCLDSGERKSPCRICGRGLRAK